MKLKKLQNKNLFIIGISILFSCKEKKQETVHSGSAIPSETTIAYSANEKDILIKVMNLRDQKNEESISSIKKQISIPSGKYFTINQQLEDYGISLKIENSNNIPV